MTTSQQTNTALLNVLANAHTNFGGTLATCKQSAAFLLSDLSNITISDLVALGFSKLSVEAFMGALTELSNFDGKRHTQQSNAYVNHIFSLLLDANQKLAAIKNTEYDSQLAAMVATPTQLIQQQADEAKLTLNDYLDLHPEAGFEFETPNFIGKDFDPLDLLEYKHRYEKISQIELDFSQPNNKRFAFVESFYQYCMWHAYQCYIKNFKPIMDLCASQTLRNSKKPAILIANLKSDLFDIDLSCLYPFVTGRVQLQFNSLLNHFEFILVDANIDCSDNSPDFVFCDDLGDFAETCNKRWNAQGNTQTGNLYSDYPIFSFFETVLLNL